MDLHAKPRILIKIAPSRKYASLKELNIFPNVTFQRVLQKIVNIPRHLHEANSISGAFDKTVLKRAAVSHN